MAKAANGMPKRRFAASHLGTPCVPHALNPAGFEPRIPRVTDSGLGAVCVFPHIIANLRALLAPLGELARPVGAARQSASMAAVASPAAAVETPSGFESLWDLVDVIQCITLRTRPERQRQAAAQFERVGISHRVHFLMQEPDVQDGKRGCFHAHQQAARRALELGARRALTFEDDVEFTADFTPFAAARAAKFVGGAEPWEIFFLGHFPRKMELTAQRDVVKVRSMDGHAYLLSPEGMRRLCSLEYRGDQARPIRTGWC